MPILAWNFPLIYPNFLRRSLDFPILLYSSTSLHYSFKTFLSPCCSLELCIWLGISLPLFFAFYFSHPQLSVISPSAQSLYFFFEAVNNCPLLFPSSILDTFWPGRLVFQCHIFLRFLTIPGVLLARILEGFAVPFSYAPHFVRTLHYNLPILDGPAWHGS